MSTPFLKTFSVGALVIVATLAMPAAAEAQRRGQWGPYGPYRPYPYPYPVRVDFVVSIKFDVTPKDAEVYVNGALAGIVDDFDGIFQSLEVRPGTHEIVVFHEGYRSVRESVYVEPYSNRKLRFEMEKLGAGEAQGPRPQPVPPPPADPRDRMVREPEPRPAPPAPAAQFGTLSLRIVPADAEVFVDGQRWTGPSTSDRLSIQLPTGRHRVEVRKQGLATYTEDVLIRHGATLTLNVSLR